MTSTWLRRSALLVAAAATLATACGGSDSDTGSAATAATASDPSLDATTAEPTGGQFGTASFEIDGTTYEWDVVSCSGVRTLDGVAQPGVILSSSAFEVTTGELMGFTMEQADGEWSFDISNGDTGESWTLSDATVSESGSTYDVSGEASSTSDSTPRPFQLSVSCP